MRVNMFGGGLPAAASRSVSKKRIPPIRELIGREAAFPISVCFYANDSFYDAEFDGGRFLLGHYEASNGKMIPRLERRLRPNDVVYVPLYHVQDGGPEIALQKLRYHNENLAFIRDVASSVRGILVGNCGPELSYMFYWLKHRELPRSIFSEWMSDFADETSRIIKGAGGTPFYGTRDWEMAIDHNFGEASFRDRCNELGAVQICFCGYQHFGIAQDGDIPIVPHPDREDYFEACPIMEEMPKPSFQEYLRGGEFWTGVFGLGGMMNGNDKQLLEFGYKAGVMAYSGEGLEERN